MSHNTLKTTPRGYVSRKSIGLRVILYTGATVSIADVRGKKVFFSNGTNGVIGHIMSVIG